MIYREREAMMKIIFLLFATLLSLPFVHLFRLTLVSDEPHAFPDPSLTIHNMVSQ